MQIYPLAIVRHVDHAQRCQMCVLYGTVRYGTVRYGMVRYGTVRYGYAGSCATSCAFRWTSCGMSTEFPGAAAFTLDFRRKMAQEQKEKALISGRDRYDDLFTHKPHPRNTLTKQARRVYNGGTKKRKPSALPAPRAPSFASCSPELAPLGELITVKTAP